MKTIIIKHNTGEIHEPNTTSCRIKVKVGTKVIPCPDVPAARSVINKLLPTYVEYENRMISFLLDSYMKQKRKQKNISRVSVADGLGMICPGLYLRIFRNGN